MAGSDAHCAIWVHSYFTRFARPLASVDDLVDHIRSGRTTAMARPAAHLQWCADGYRRRRLALWHVTGDDWRALAEAQGWDLDTADREVGQFKRVGALAARGASIVAIIEETGLTPEMAGEYLDIAEDARYFLVRRESTA